LLSLHWLLRVLGVCAFTLLLPICAPHASLFRPPIPTPPCSFPLLFGLYLPACIMLTPSLYRALRHLQHHFFLHHHHPRPRRASSAVPQHEHRDVSYEGPLEAQAQHYAN
jgi:hypothetical protein